METDNNKIFEESKNLLESCKHFEKENNAKKKELEFLLNEYKTNKRWFRNESAQITDEDIIKAAFEFGWTSRHQYDLNPDLFM